MKIKIITLLTCLISFFAQTQSNDSISNALKEQIKLASTDSIKIPFQLEQAEHVMHSNIDSARVIAKDVQKLLDNKGYTNYYQQQRARLFQILSSCDELQQDFVESLKYLQQAIDIAININDSLSLGESYRIKGLLSFRKKDTIKAKRYYRKAINIQKKINDSSGIAKSYIHLGVLFYYNAKKRDSMVYFLNLAKEVDPSLQTRMQVDTNLGSVYMFGGDYDKSRLIYEDLIVQHKKLKNYLGLSNCFSHLGNVYAFLNEQDKSLQAIDSAIAYSKIMENKDNLVYQYESRRNINRYFGDYKAAFKDFELYKIYSDSINDIEQAKRFTEIELNYKFDKEKEIAAIKLGTETSKKKLYFALLIISLLSGLILIYFIRKSNKQKLKLAKNKIELGQVEKLKTELALANRETELKKIVIENSITEEVLNKTLDDIKEIITFENERERQTALKTLSASLLSEKITQKTTSSLQSYLDEVSIDFKVLLDTKYPQLKPNEKELLCLIKIGLNITETSKLLNSTVSAVKSSRHRIRKKLGLNDSKQDILTFIYPDDSNKFKK